MYKKFRPIHIFWEHGVKDEDIDIIITTIIGILYILGIRKKIIVKKIGIWDFVGCEEQGIPEGDKWRGYYDGERIVDKIIKNKTVVKGCYTVIVMKSPMFFLESRKNLMY